MSEDKKRIAISVSFETLEQMNVLAKELSATKSELVKLLVDGAYQSYELKKHESEESASM